MSDLLDKWLAHYDPIHRGWTLNGIANAVCTTVGWFFPRIAGGYNLRRAIARKPQLTDHIVGAAAADARQIANFPWISHSPGTVYYYRLNAIGGGGVEEECARNVLRVAFDEQGLLAGPLPNPPSSLHVMPGQNGSFVVKWTYSWLDEEVPPAEFRLYTDGGSGSFDYSSPEATVPFRAGKLDYEYNSRPFPRGLTVGWVVRSVSAEGHEEQNEMVASARVDAIGPPAVTFISVEPGEEKRA